MYLHGRSQLTKMHKGIFKTKTNLVNKYEPVDNVTLD